MKTTDDPEPFAASGGSVPLELEPTAESGALVRSGVGRVRAFAVTTRYWSPPHTSIYAATSAAKAKFKSWNSAQDAGWYSMTFGDLSVRRAPEFDCIAGQLKHGVDREYACLLRQKAGAEPVANESAGESKSGAQAPNDSSSPTPAREAEATNQNEDT